MLDVYHSIPIITLGRDDSKIVALASQGDRLFVGLQNGTLRVYLIHQHPLSSSNLTDLASSDFSPDRRRTEGFATLVREEENVFTSEVRQLQAVSSCPLLVSLARNCITLLDMETFECRQVLTQSEGASAFAIISCDKLAEDSPSASRWKLAASVKESLLVWTWLNLKSGSLHEIDFQKVSLSSYVRSFCWINQHTLVATTQDGFSLVRMQEQPLSSSAPGAPSRPSLLPQPVGSPALLRSEAGRRYLSNWRPGIPLLSRPVSRLVTPLPNERALLLNGPNCETVDMEGKALNSNRHPWPGIPVSVRVSSPYIISLHDSPDAAMEIRNMATFSLLQTLSLPGARLLCLALSDLDAFHGNKIIFVASSDVVWLSAPNSIESQIHKLLEQQAYDDALELLSASGDFSTMNRTETIREIKRQKALMLFEKRHFRSAMDLFLDGGTSPCYVISLYPRAVFGLDDIGQQSLQGEDLKAESAGASTHLYSQLKAKLRSHAAGRHSVYSGTITLDSVMNSFGSGDNAVALEGSVCEAALSELSRFLLSIHSQLASKFLEADGTIKATAWSGNSHPGETTQPPEFFYLLDGFPHISPSKYCQKLHETAVVVDTALFCAYMRTNPALISNLFQVKNWCHPLVVTDYLLRSKFYDSLIDFLQSKGAHREALELLSHLGNSDSHDSLYSGPQKLLSYLRRLKGADIDIILEYIDLPFEQNPELTLDFFMDDKSNTQHLPQTRLLDFLLHKGSIWAIRYLEYLIYQRNCEDSVFHDRLIQLYQSNLRGADNDSVLSQKATQLKLEDFLRCSEHYDPSKALQNLPPDPIFYASRAIALDREGSYEEALKVLIFQIGSCEMGERYCNEVYNRTHPSSKITADKGNEIFSTFLKLLLSPPPPNPANLQAAKNVLSKYGSRLPGYSTLELIRDDPPIADTAKFLTSRLRLDCSELNKSSFVSTLCELDSASISAHLSLQQKGKKVTIAEQMRCGDCDKPFRDAFVRIRSNNTPVHYACARRVADR